jgi:tetratricopeptide (TPR) repeat protein
VVNGRVAFRLVSIVGSLVTILCMSCASFSSGTGSATEARFEQGNKTYEEGDYQRASEIYQELIDQGDSLPALHYNLGNALFKLNHLGPAILEYERANRLAPGDPDIRDNLDYSRSLTVDRITPASTPFTALGISMLLDLSSPSQDAAILMSTWFLAGAAGIILILGREETTRRYAAYTAVLCLIPVLAAGASLATKSYIEQTRIEAILMEPQIDVLSGAGDDNPALFTIHEGLKVRVRNSSNGWVQISLEDGLTGWVRGSALTLI